MVKRFFTGEKREFLLSFLEQHKTHKQAETVEDFWPIIIPAYIAKFPEDDVDSAPTMSIPPKTKSGKPSKKRASDQPKPLREVSILVDILRAMVDKSRSE
jgi:hypothetical protein